MTGTEKDIAGVEYEEGLCGSNIGKNSS